MSKQKNTTKDLFRSAQRGANFFIFPSDDIMLSDSIFKDETSVVKIAPAMRMPHANFSRNFSDTAKTGIDECISSDKTTVCSINKIANRHMHIKAQARNICL